MYGGQGKIKRKKQETKTGKIGEDVVGYGVASIRPTIHDNHNKNNNTLCCVYAADIKE